MPLVAEADTKVGKKPDPSEDIGPWASRRARLWSTRGQFGRFEGLVAHYKSVERSAS